MSTVHYTIWIRFVQDIESTRVGYGQGKVKGGIFPLQFSMDLTLLRDNAYLDIRRSFITTQCDIISRWHVRVHCSHCMTEHMVFMSALNTIIPKQGLTGSIYNKFIFFGL